MIREEPDQFVVETIPKYWRPLCTIVIDSKSKSQIDSLFESKNESIIRGLRHDCKKHLQRISMQNALIIIINYVASAQTEINLSNSCKMDLIIVLCRLSYAIHHKPFEQITRQDVVAFLDNFRKFEEVDPLHKWVGTFGPQGALVHQPFRRTSKMWRFTY